jgi:phosphatidylserine/phosphatidylglycerophosphate/cardiolipin synthase-like enzyme
VEEALAAHGEEFREEAWAELPDAVKALGPKLELEADVEDITRWLVFDVPQWLRHPNIELRVPKKEGDLAKLRKVHHKLMVIDDRIVVAGSFNYTQPANDYNDENLFVVGSPHAEVGGIEVEADPVKEVAVHMRAEIERLFALSAPFVPANP